MRRRASAFYLETTEVPAERTVQEITDILARIGARQVTTQFGSGGEIAGMHWTLLVEKREIGFNMPVRTEGVLRLLKDRARAGVAPDKLKAKAQRIAWRQLLKWIQIQHAMIQTGMANVDEIFMPYSLGAGGVTLYQAWQRQLALPTAETK